VIQNIRRSCTPDFDQRTLRWLRLQDQESVDLDQRWSERSVLITGGLGFIGSSLAIRLVELVRRPAINL